MISKNIPVLGHLILQQQSCLSLIYVWPLTTNINENVQPPVERETLTIYSAILILNQVNMSFNSCNNLQIKHDFSMHLHLPGPSRDVENIGIHPLFRERSGSVVECLTRDRGAAGLSLTGLTALCP